MVALPILPPIQTAVSVNRLHEELCGAVITPTLLAPDTKIRLDVLSYFRSKTLLSALVQPTGVLLSWLNTVPLKLYDTIFPLGPPI